MCRYADQHHLNPRCSIGESNSIHRLQEETPEVSERGRDNLIEQQVIYALEMDGRSHIVENVPARVDEERGERFFSPSTVERLQCMIVGHAKLSKVIETPVYEYNE